MIDAVKRVNPRYFVRDGKAKLGYSFEEWSVVSSVFSMDVAQGKLGFEALRVMHYLLAVCKHSNRFTETQAVIGERLGMQRQNVWRAFRELREAGYVIRVSDPDGHRYWYVDARRAFRGSPERHAKEVARQAKQRSKDRKVNVVALRADAVPA
ncbi:MAG: Crp-like helix-turn-helix domain protein [Microviridae sp.]|nr:MAG: Crp-like helix-turn-helix domain protein [Microviridae sp.]